MKLFHLLSAVSLAQHVLAARLRIKSQQGAGLAAQAHMTLHTTMGYMVQDMLRTKTTTSRHIVKKMHHHMKLHEAMEHLEGKLPKNVETLLGMTSDTHAASAGQFTEASLEKARIYLNNMMYDAWLRLDQIEIECKEFEESNREVFNQITTDLEHIGAESAERYRLKVEAGGGIDDMDARISETGTTRRDVKRDYERVRDRNAGELQLRTDDQDVFSAILQISKCPAGDSQEYELSTLQFCEDSDGTEKLDSEDEELLEKISTAPRVETALLQVLGGAKEHMNVTSLVQLRQDSQRNGKGRGNPGSWKNCRTPEKVNCGLIHDTMAMEWGRFRDLVDELTFEMEQDFDAYEKERANLNQQIGTLRGTKSKYQEMLDEAVSDINSMSATTRLKEQQQRDIQRAYDKEMDKCKDRITEILYTEICGVRTVRNTLMRYSSKAKPRNIMDCDVTDWSPGPCTTDGRPTSTMVMCDDSCPKDVGGVDLDACGGVKYLTRQIVVSPNEYGMACPPLEFERTNGSKGMKCNQFHCPVACVLSEWSGWSECSKECGQGTQGKTRSVLTKNKNGGQECDSTFEEQPCHTGSCNRDCELAPWTDWGPCSQACGGGMQTRVRNVDTPIRANGKCPRKNNPSRLEERECNTQDCVGDEICIAKQDLVLVVDGSGSLKQEGFDSLTNLTYNLTHKYQATYFGQDDMQLGLVEFGNGEYFDNGTVAPALSLVDLTADLASVRKAIAAMSWLKGFTNMMQGMEAADAMFENGRDDAQSAMLILSDGKYTSGYRTGQKAQELKDKGVTIFIAHISRQRGDKPSVQMLRSWASDPWRAHYVRIRGWRSLKNNEERFAQQMLVEFCPRAFSPSQTTVEEEQVGFLKLHEGGFPDDACAAWENLGPAVSPESCFEKARARGVLAFTIEINYRWSACYAEDMAVSDDMWSKALQNRTDIACPSGAWLGVVGADTYIMNPSMFGDLLDDATPAPADPQTSSDDEQGATR